MKTVDKATTRTTKRNVEPQAPQAPVRTGGNRRGNLGGNEGGKFALLWLPEAVVPSRYVDADCVALQPSVIAPLAESATRAVPPRRPLERLLAVARVLVSVVVSHFL